VNDWLSFGDLGLVTGLGILAVGFAAGVLSGMFGVGGAVLTTPGIRALGTTPIQAVGSTIPAILPGARTGTWRYAREGLVDWRIGLICGAAGSAFAVAGAQTSGLVDGRWLMVLTAALLAVSGFRVTRSGAPADQDVRAGVPPSTAPAAEPTTVPDLGTPALGLVGAASGFLAGLLGVGGGVLMMPIFTSVLRIPVKVAVASSLVAVAIFSVPALVSHWLQGNIDWPVALLLMLGTVPGAAVGSRITVASSDASVRRWLGLFFMVIAALYGALELRAIVAA
jgi:uncharacterized membrane protein YfcA